jgi:hypothetical protein
LLIAEKAAGNEKLAPAQLETHPTLPLIRVEVNGFKPERFL